MPPKAKLPQQAIADLTAWVRMGVPWPEARSTTGRTPAVGSRRVRRPHWAFRPVRSAGGPPPSATPPGQVRPVDAFILAGLERKGTALSPRPTGGP